MIWFAAIPTAAIALWFVVAFLKGAKLGLRDDAAATFLMERPVDDWPHMDLGTLAEIDRLVGLIRDGRVLRVALVRFVEARPALCNEVLRLAATAR